MSGSLFRTPAERQRAREERTLRHGKVEVGPPRTDHPGEYHAQIEPPPNFLTDDQLDIFDALKVGVEAPDEGFTGYQLVCWYEGIPEPSDEAVQAEIDLRMGGSS